jgi:hypothetical protein
MRRRYHLCWGSWHGPHTHDLPLEHIIDLILEVKAQTYSFEAGNVRHKHPATDRSSAFHWLTSMGEPTSEGLGSNK